MIGRRSFLKLGEGALRLAKLARGRSAGGRGDHLRLASFGAAGMAFSTLDGIATHPSVTLACVAEVDSKRLARVKQKYPEARVYDDWRRMLDKERRNIDIACVGTPDHMHAPMAMR